MKVAIKRVYETPSPEDGTRILVDRLWPRGLKKERAGVDLWLKELAPSNELRTWFGHDPEKWGEFKKRYGEELRGKGEMFKTVQTARGKGKVTLVYAAKDEEHNNAVALQEALENFLD